MRKKKKKNFKSPKSNFLLKFWIAFILIGAVAFLVIQYLMTSRNSPYKAGVLKKTYNVSSQKITPQIECLPPLRIPIIMYHYVEYIYDQKDKTRQLMNITPNIFESQLKSLVDHKYKTIFVREIPELLKGSPDSCIPSVALTFDDGYIDFYTYVFPLLKKYNAKATVYIIADYIDKPNFLTEAQIADLAKSGLVEVGSHTLDHADLTTAASDDAVQQIINSKRLLEARFQIQVDTFSYPFGKFNDIHIDLVKQASYSAGVTVSDGIIHSEGDIYTLNRVRPEQFIGYDIAVVLEQYKK